MQTNTSNIRSSVRRLARRLATATILTVVATSLLAQAPSSSASYWRFLFGALTTTSLPASHQAAFLKNYSAQFGLNQQEASALASAAKAYASAVAAAHTQALATQNSAGGSASTSSQQQYTTITAQLATQIEGLGAQFLGAVRPQTAQSIQAAINSAAR